MELMLETTKSNSFAEEPSSSSYATAVQGDLSHSPEEGEDKLLSDEMSDDTVINIYTRDVPEAKGPTNTPGLLGRLGKMVSNRVLVERNADNLSSKKGGTSDISQNSQDGDEENFPLSSANAVESIASLPQDGTETIADTFIVGATPIKPSKEHGPILAASCDNSIECVEDEAEGGMFINASSGEHTVSSSTTPSADEAPTTVAEKEPPLDLQPEYNVTRKLESSEPLTDEGNIPEKASAKDSESVAGSMVDVSINDTSLIVYQESEEAIVHQTLQNVGLFRRIGKLMGDQDSPEQFASQVPLDNTESATREKTTENTNEQVRESSESTCDGGSHHEGVSMLNDREASTQSSSPQPTRASLVRNRWIKSARKILITRPDEGSEKMTESNPTDVANVRSLQKHVSGGSDDETVNPHENKECLIDPAVKSLRSNNWAAADDVVFHPTRRGRLLTAVKQLVEARLSDPEHSLRSEGPRNSELFKPTATSSEPRPNAESAKDTPTEQANNGIGEFSNEGNGMYELEIETTPSSETPGTNQTQRISDEKSNQHRRKWMTAVRKVLSTRSFEGSAWIVDEKEFSCDKDISEAADSMHVCPKELGDKQGCNTSIPVDIVAATKEWRVEGGASDQLRSSPNEHTTEKGDLTENGSSSLAVPVPQVGNEKGTVSNNRWETVRRVLRSRSFGNESIGVDPPTAPNEDESTHLDTPTLGSKSNDGSEDLATADDQTNRLKLQRNRWISSMMDIVSTRSFGGNECVVSCDVGTEVPLPTTDDAGLVDEERLVASAADENGPSAPDKLERKTNLEKPKLHRARWITSVRSLISTDNMNLSKDGSGFNDSSSVVGPLEYVGGNVTGATDNETLCELESEGEHVDAYSSALNSFMATKGGWTPTDIRSGLALVDEELVQNPPTERREFLQGLKLYLEQEQMKVLESRESSAATFPNEAQARVA